MIAPAPAPPKSSAAVPSSQRAIPLRGRTDLKAEAMEFQQSTWWVIKDPIGLKYHRVTAEQFSVMKLLDGERSLKEIRDALSQEFPATILQLSDVQQMITSLHQRELLWNERPGQSASLFRQGQKHRRKKLLETLRNPLSIRFSGWDPDATLQGMDKWLGWIFHPASMVIFSLFVVSTWLLILTHVDEFRSRLPEFQQFFGWHNLAWLWLTMGAIKVLHEFGHGLACRHCGSECHEMGVMVLVFSPTLYCDVTDSWMLRNKWQRIGIGAAGMGVEVVLSAIAILGWWFTTPGLLNHLCLNAFFVSTITTVIFNANPLLKYDGYYMLSDLVGIPNLRERANAVLQDVIAQSLGVTRPRDPMNQQGSTFWLAAYAIAATVNGWILLGTILVFLCSMLKPYGLQPIGYLLGIVSVAGILGRMLTNVNRLAISLRNEPVQSVRPPLVAATLLVLIGLALAIPLPWSIEAPCIVEPHNVVHVLATAGGELTEFAVRPGDTVEQGQVLVRLRDFQREDALRRLRVSRGTQLAEIDVLHAMENVSEHALAIERLQSIESRLKELESQLAELTIRAPIAGVVVAAPPVPASRQSTSHRLSDWQGNISDPANLGCQVQPRTHLLSISPDDKMQVVMYLDQAHRDDLRQEHQVQIKFEHLPAETFSAPVETIAREHCDTAPSSLTVKHGGPLASITDKSGMERLTSVAYLAKVVVDHDTHLMKSGMRGTSRFLVESHSALGWVWRAICRTVNFRM
ncbi:MAG: HlyD family efflux transporter periplasmic adaptor subunit [Planctomycetota bacterium]